MNIQISSIDLHYLINESQILIDSRVDKIYHPDKEQLVIQFHTPKAGKKMLRVVSGKALFITEVKDANEEPSGFCMYLRKYLEGTRLREISQVGSERIVKLVFEAKEDNYFLYAELFGKGNIVITDKNDIILNALEQKKWADRDIKKGLKYQYPKRDFNLFHLSKRDFGKIIGENKRDIGFILAKEIGIGGTFSDEICKLANVDNEKKELSEKEIEAIYKSFLKIINQDSNPKAVIKDNEVKQVLPFSIDKINGEIEEIKSMSSGFDMLIKQGKTFKSKHQSAIDKTEGIIAQQKKQIDELLAKVDEEQKKGELIYEKYQFFQDIINQLNEARKKYSLEEIKQKLGGNKTVVSFDSKEKKVKIKI